MRYAQLASVVAAAVVGIVPEIALAHCCGDPAAPDVFDTGKDLDTAFGIDGKLTAEQAEEFTRVNEDIASAVAQFLQQLGVQNCQQKDFLPLKEGDDWHLTPFGRAPSLWGPALDCGDNGDVYVELMPRPYADHHDDLWKVVSKDARLIALVSTQDALSDERKLVIGELGVHTLPVRVPLWARPHAAQLTLTGRLARLASKRRLNTEVLATALKRQPEGPLMAPAPTDVPTEIGDVERHILERAIIASLLPAEPSHPAAVSDTMIGTHGPYDMLNAFRSADLGLPPSLVTDFLARSEKPSRFPSYLSVGERQIVRRSSHLTVPLINFSPVGISSDRKRAMVFVSVDYPGNHYRAALLVLRESLGRWSVEYSSLRIVC